MASVPKLKRLTREDFKDAPVWIERLLYWLNIFFEAVNRALSNGLTIEENMSAQTKTFQITAGAAATNNTTNFALTMKTVPNHLFVGKVMNVTTDNYNPIGSAVFVEWRYQDGQVYITSITGLTNGNVYEFNVMLF
jgi:hypothetical protein